MVIHQSSAFVRFLQGTVQHNAGCDPGQFHDRGSDHQGNIPGTRQGDERLGIYAARIGDRAAGRRDCHIRYIVLVPEREAPEIHGKGAVWITPEYFLKRDLIGDPGVVVPTCPVGEGHCSFSLEPCGDDGDRRSLFLFP